MVALAILALVIVHPGIYFPALRKDKRGETDQENQGTQAAEKTAGESSSDDSGAESSKA